MRRRDALLALAAGCAATTFAQSRPFTYQDIDHLEFFVSNLDRSLDFYTRIFGNGLWKNRSTARRYLQLGNCYIAFEQGPNLVVDHFALGVTSFDIAAAHQTLDRLGLPYRDYPSGRDLAILDPDGTRLQMTAARSWEQLKTNTANPEPRPFPYTAIFEPLDIDHLLVNAKDLNASAAHYDKLLGPREGNRADRATWRVGTSRLEVQKTPDGRKEGVDHYSVLVKPFDPAKSLAALQQLGARMVEGSNNTSPYFQDPDGYYVQVTAAA